LVQIVDGEAPPACPACGRQMRHFADFEIYECRECRLFVSEKVRQSDVNNVNITSPAAKEGQLAGQLGSFSRVNNFAHLVFAARTFEKVPLTA